MERAVAISSTLGWFMRRRDVVLPKTLRRPGQTLLHLQCWCWGADIRRAEGNLLLEYGFVCARTAAATVGTTSRYTLACSDGVRIQLWGWGLLYADVRGAFFLGRYQFTPAAAGDPSAGLDAFEPHELAGFRAPETPEQLRCQLAMLGDACRWIAEYERWVLDRVGLLYRRDVVGAWKKARVVAERVGPAWLALAKQVDACATAASLTSVTVSRMRAGVVDEAWSRRSPAGGAA